jgi:outer membrane cobalamin receptor
VKFKLYTIYILLVLAVTAFAEEPLRHQEVIITASPIAADNIDTEFQTGRVTVITSESFDANLETVADVIRNETGVQIRQSNGIGSYSSVTIRGSSSAQVNVYLDGVLVNSAHGGTVDLSQFLLNGVDSIEIYRGNVPVQLGAAGIGGAINIITKSASKEPVKKVTVGFGSYNTKKASATFNVGNNFTRYAGSIERLSSDNDYALLNDNQTRNNPEDDKIEKRQNAQFEQVSALMSINHHSNENWHTNTVIQYFDKKNGLPEVSNDPINQADYDTQSADFKFKLEQSFKHDLSASYLVYASQKNTRYDDTQNKIGLSANLEESQINTLGLKTDFSKSHGSHLLNLSAHVRNESYDFGDLLRDLRQKNNRLESVLAIQDEWLSTSGNLLVSLRMSFRHLTDSLKTGNQEEDSRHYLDAHMGFRYQLSSSNVLRANISRDIRIPALDELYGDKGAILGNSQLKEETAINADFGISSEFTHARFSGAVYYRQLTDAIIMIYDSRGIGRPENIAKAMVAGLEFEASKNFSYWWDFAIKATLQTSEDQSKIPSSRGNPLPGQYENKASFVNTFKVNNLAFIFEFEHLSDGNYDSGAAASLRASNQYHFSINHQFDAHRLELQIKNLSDERIEYFNRFPGPGRRAFITYTHNF